MTREQKIIIKDFKESLINEMNVYIDKLLIILDKNNQSINNINEKMIKCEHQMAGTNDENKIDQIINEYTKLNVDKIINNAIDMIIEDKARHILNYLSKRVILFILDHYNHIKNTRDLNELRKVINEDNSLFRIEDYDSIIYNGINTIYLYYQNDKILHGKSIQSYLDLNINGTEPGKKIYEDTFNSAQKDLYISKQEILSYDDLEKACRKIYKMSLSKDKELEILQEKYNEKRYKIKNKYANLDKLNILSTIENLKQQE